MFRRMIFSVCLLALVLWTGGVAQAAPPKFAVGASHTLALKADGTLWAWGQNTYGQLGDGTTDAHATPVPIASAVSWEAVAAGTAHSVALKADGTLWAWGRNNYGQLGNGASDQDPHPTPVKIGAGTTWVAIAAGAYHALGERSSSNITSGIASSFNR